ncbi:MAG: GNAT family N-acetyltransferase [Kiritimatiellia bacterium]|jgi:ribosomal protein S18 acetylase RimI-like enzyme
MDISRVCSESQISDVAELARVIWTDHFTPIIGRDQVDYMLDKFQSEKAIAAQIGDGYEYYAVSRDGRIVGYLAVAPDAGAGMLMISKIYVLKSERGHGLGRAMLEFAEDLCRERRFHALYLTVNKNNRSSIAWYARMGFRNAGSLVQDIGGGFWMDDYRMEKTIGQPSPADGPQKPAPGERRRPQDTVPDSRDETERATDRPDG